MQCKASLSIINRHAIAAHFSMFSDTCISDISAKIIAYRQSIVSDSVSNSDSAAFLLWQSCYMDQILATPAQTLPPPPSTPHKRPRRVLRLQLRLIQMACFVVRSRLLSRHIWRSIYPFHTKADVSVIRETYFVTKSALLLVYF